MKKKKIGKMSWSETYRELKKSEEKNQENSDYYRQLEAHIQNIVKEK